MSTGRSQGEQDAGGGDVLITDAGRDRIEVHIRLDKVVLAIGSEARERVQAELTPADARAAAEMLTRAAAGAEQTPH